MSLKRFHINGKDMFRVDSKTGPFVDASVAEALHEALEIASDILHDVGDDSDPAIHKARRLARAALARARGETDDKPLEVVL